MLFPVHEGLGIAPNVEYRVAKVPTTLPPISRLLPVSGERIARLHMYTPIEKAIVIPTPFITFFL